MPARYFQNASFIISKASVKHSGININLAFFNSLLVYSIMNLFGPSGRESKKHRKALWRCLALCGKEGIMFRLKSLLVFCIIVLVLPVAAHTQQQQYTDQQFDQTEERMSEIKSQLEKRSRALQVEWKALKKEQEELKKISRRGSLSGSKKNKYVKRNADLSIRKMKYIEDKEKLSQDINAYETAVKKMETDLLETPDAQPAAMKDSQAVMLSEEQISALEDALNNAGVDMPVSAGDPEEIDKIIELLGQRREELLEEYQTLQAEQQQIAMPGQNGRANESAPPDREQVYELNEKLKEFAETKKRFNDAVTAVNEMLGQNVQTLPGP